MPDAAGSSPRVRGTVRRPSVASVHARLIPACAGNGTDGAPPRRNRPAHPRVCGERWTDGLQPIMRIGSSPRVRGTVCEAGQRRRSHRLIPACAGNGWDVLETQKIPDGSSPRVRGTVPHQCQMGRARRLIPACAGNGACQASSLTRDAAHPRVCGERAAGGSAGLGDRRLIPACAGNGPSLSRLPIAHPAHPRVCGERLAGNSKIRPVTGSSPRVRGTGRLSPRSRGTCRLIPACAGNGTADLGTRPQASAHPRVCGERRLGRLARSACGGSSPRVRGTGDPGQFVVNDLRLIPACAGNGLSVGSNPESYSQLLDISHERYPRTP